MKELIVSYLIDSRVLMLVLFLLGYYVMNHFSSKYEIPTCKKLNGVGEPTNEKLDPYLWHKKEASSS